MKHEPYKLLSASAISADVISEKEVEMLALWGLADALASPSSVGEQKSPVDT
jgi:hypothetical protein